MLLRSGLLLVLLILTLGWNPMLQAEETQTYLAKAQAALDQDDTRTALIHLKNILEAEPDNAQAYYLLGEAYLKLGRAAAAESVLQRARTLGLAGAPWRAPLARAYFLQGKYEQIIQDIKLDPNDPPDVRGSLLALAAQAEIARGNEEQGRKLLASARAASPDNIDMLVGFTQLALKQGDLSEVNARLEQLTAKNPKRVDVWVTDGEVKRWQKHYAEALASYEKALALQPANLLAWLGKGSIFLEQQNWGQALQAADTVLAALPNLAEALYLRALALYRQQNVPAARETLQRSIQVAPEYLPAWLLLGQIEYKLDHVDQARDLVRHVVERQPNHSGSRKLLAAIELKRNQPDEALKALQGIPEKTAASDPEALLLLGNAYLQKKDYDKGSAYLEKAVALTPKSGDARTQLAMSYVLTGQSNKAAGELDAATLLGDADAVKPLEQIWEQNPNRFNIGLLLLRQYLRLRQDDKALALARTLAQNNPTQPKVQSALALALLAGGDRNGAVAQARKLTETQPQSAPAWHLLGITYERADPPNFIEAVKSWDKALAVDKNYLPALEAKTRLRLREQQYKEAQELARAIQTRFPNQPLGYSLEGEGYARQKEFDKAAAAYQKALAKRPDTALLLAQADAEWQAGKQQTAVETLRTWLAKNANDSAARTQLAIYLQLLPARDEAIQEYERVLDLNPNAVTALNNLALLYQQAGDPRALILAEQAGKLAPQSPEIIDTLGWILVQSNQLERGLTLLQQAASQSSDPATHYHLAVAYAKAGRREEARQQLETALQSGRPFEGKEDAQALRESLK